MYAFCSPQRCCPHVGVMRAPKRHAEALCQCLVWRPRHASAQTEAAIRETKAQKAMRATLGMFHLCMWQRMKRLQRVPTASTLRICTTHKKQCESEHVVYSADWVAIRRQQGIQMITTARSNVKHKMCKACCYVHIPACAVTMCAQTGCHAVQQAWWMRAGGCERINKHLQANQQKET